MVRADVLLSGAGYMRPEWVDNIRSCYLLPGEALEAVLWAHIGPGAGASRGHHGFFVLTSRRVLIIHGIGAVTGGRAGSDSTASIPYSAITSVSAGPGPGLLSPGAELHLTVFDERHQVFLFDRYENKAAAARDRILAHVLYPARA
jgi:hypothetical protein